MQAGEQQQQADDSSMHLNATTDWDDSEASLNQISTSIKGKADSTANGQAGAGTNGSNDNLWEDNWDDDDIEDDFSVQLRYVVLPTHISNVPPRNTGASTDCRTCAIAGKRYLNRTGLRIWLPRFVQPNRLKCAFSLHKIADVKNMQ